MHITTNHTLITYVDERGYVFGIVYHAGFVKCLCFFVNLSYILKFTWKDAYMDCIWTKCVIINHQCCNNYSNLICIRFLMMNNNYKYLNCYKCNRNWTVIFILQIINLLQLLWWWISLSLITILIPHNKHYNLIVNNE